MHYFKKQMLTILLIMPLFIANSLQANVSEFDNASLWLPKAYETHSDKLKDAAIAIKATEKCHRLLSGKLLEGKSSPEHLIFTFRCRTIERFSFSVEFDDNTKEIYDPYEPIRLKEEQDRLLKEKQDQEQEQELKEQEEELKEQQEQQRLQEELERKQQEKANCQKAMNNRIKEFKEPIFIKDSFTGPISEDNIIFYQWLFDSKSSKNEPLYYQIVCKVVSENDYRLKVTPRAKAFED
jgi:hypothetical protein